MEVSEAKVNIVKQAYPNEAAVGPQQDVEQAKAPEPQKPAGDKVTLSQNAKELQVAKDSVAEAPDVREALVQDLKKQVKSGAYEVNAQQIADKMVGSKIDEMV